ncbi:type II toxin-antitoxin system VapC family toxin [Leifsonia sp. SIMBA_070]|uniref:type II toxin-antitoxin system VapC family toxin n=1 Tax=Leifsonia sp. SIMBA_070 TaxID=3085810 RepID=UPI00397898C4
MVDTSVIVAGLTPEIIAHIEDYVSSAICRAELARGLAVFHQDASRPLRATIRQELLELLDSIPGFWLDFDARAADGYGRLTSQPRSAMRLKDALIAGHAYAHDLTLVTLDSGFSRFPSVRLEVLEPAGAR